MEWIKDNVGWWDLNENGEDVASYQAVNVDGGFAEPSDFDAQWVILWHRVGDDEYLNPNEYTEDQVRHHIELKYKLLRGEHG